MNIAFTGHRDRLCVPDALDKIANQYPFARWIHGGAPGFDTQVQRYAVSHGIETTVIRPDYQKYPGRTAPIIRNQEIVDKADLLVACYDGRLEGGTFFTVQYARKKGKTVILTAIQKAPA
jgi:hypothetical protein